MASAGGENVNDAPRAWVIGNWKMNGNGSDLSEIQAIASMAEHCDGVKVAICPPATLIERAASTKSELMIGAQDCHAGDGGSFTGQLSPSMVRDAGARLVIVGHSECRALIADPDTAVRQKAEAALAVGLTVVVCVGETLAIRECGREGPFVLAQLVGSMPATASCKLVVAYEPLWSIGTGRTPTADQIKQMHARIRVTLFDLYGEPGASVPILYGGSANPGNAAALLSIEGVDGLLVGGASLKADSFNCIIDAAAHRAGSESPAMVGQEETTT